MNLKLSLVCAIMASPALAQEGRQLDSHEHGVGELNIALDGNTVAMELHAPGADIVGFEYAAQSAEDRAAIDTAVATLARPLDLFALPADAECSVVQASAELENENEHDDDDGHDDHADDDGHGELEEGHDETEAGHTEFHAEYLLNCADPGAITEISFTYFDAFENALELEVQIVSTNGAQAFEVERAEPTLDLRGMF